MYASGMLILEGFLNDDWVTAMVVKPGQDPEIVSDNRDGQRFLYFLECAPGHSTISRAIVPPGDGEMVLHRHGITRVLFNQYERTVVATLTPGESYEMQIKPDGAMSDATVRFRHVHGN